MRSLRTLFINGSCLMRLYCVCYFFTSPPQSVQVVRTRRASSCQDRGGVGQRDQGLVSGKGSCWILGVFWRFLIYILRRAEKNERKPTHFSYVVLVRRSDFQRLVYVRYRIKRCLGKNEKTAALVSLLLPLLFQVAKGKLMSLSLSLVAQPL